VFSRVASSLPGKDGRSPNPAISPPGPRGCAPACMRNCRPKSATAAGGMWRCHARQSHRIPGQCRPDQGRPGC
jgi:hypothetical protein